MTITTVNVDAKIMMKEGSVFSNAEQSIGMKTIANAFVYLRSGKNAQQATFMIQ